MKKEFNIWIITLFPELFKSFAECGIIGQVLSGSRGKKIKMNIVSLRDYTTNSYKGVDDSPYGGGPGMVMRADILKNALIKGVVEVGSYGEDFREKLHIISPGPKGTRWNSKMGHEFAQKNWSESSSKDLVFICGRYEGIDERFIKLYVDEEISIGDFILSGGELAVQTILDSSLRFCPGTLGNRDGAFEESFQNNLLEHGQYTRPRVFERLEVPEVLTESHHKKIQEYQLKEQEKLTQELRPDLFKKYRSNHE